MHYSIWGMLDPENANMLNAIIQDISAENGVAPFPPHITVVGSVEGGEEQLLRRLKELETLLRPYDLRVSDVLEFDNKYRCVVLGVDPTPEVMYAHTIAKRVFSAKQADYVPHVSLLYATMPEQRRLEIVARLKASRGELPKTMAVTHLALYATTGPHTEWREIGRAKLKKR